MRKQKPKLLIHNPRILILLTAVVAVVLLSLVFILESSSPNPDATSLDDKPQVQVASAELSVEGIREWWSRLSLQKCDSVRAYRHQMHIKEYSKVVDSFYYHYVFDVMKQGVAENVDKLKGLSDQEKLVANSEIFSYCQNMCAELIREIADELREYQYGQTE